MAEEVAKDPRVQALSDTESARRRSRSNSFSNFNRMVLVAVDPSEFAKFSFEWYLDNVHRPDDLIILVYIPEPPKLPSFSFKSGIAPPVDEWKKCLDEMNSKTRSLEEDYEGTCIQKKFKYKIRGEACKNPGEGIVRIAHDEGADLIVIGSRGLGKVKRALIGSVSEYVVRHSGIPTLIVQNKKARSGSVVTQ